MQSFYGDPGVSVPRFRFYLLSYDMSRERKPSIRLRNMIQSSDRRRKIRTGNSVGDTHEREFTHTKSLLADMGFDAGRAGVALTLEVDKQELKRRESQGRTILLRYREVVPGAHKDCKRSLEHTVRVWCRSHNDCLPLSRGISTPACCDMLGVPRSVDMRRLDREANKRIDDLSHHIEGQEILGLTDAYRQGKWCGYGVG